ncbi:PREDICTED: synaptic vesicle membrane protein VAT-1 homolog-like [Ceratosolen solmsi marchali]|uniref:Synaptic vesicle membrane protein VAT-1 homolog-like n=1 Tax=Ceratosolen solmsi marchali TaxID=326594 RepID=A0AAJ6YGY9_9HYME|nr:PREDICTED: synaptic vesicle membrane protein VAT-1 homolog-like [Ceratosolen solmsi marchali]
MSEDKDMNLHAEGDSCQQQETISIDDKEINGIKKEKNEKNDVNEKIVENGDGDKPKENGEKSIQEPPKEMRAVVLNGFGGFKIKALKKPEPTLSENEVLIKIKACGLSFQDLLTKQGTLDNPPKPPFIMGFECAGEIAEVGEGVTNFKVGDRVVALPDHKAWAEYVSVPAVSVYSLPAGMNYDEAVAITLNYTVGYILLFELANLRPGKSILLHSAGGGVGQAVVQLAKTVEDVTIFGVCNKNKHEILKSSGNIDHLLERGVDYSGAVRKESPEGVDIVLDCLYGEEYRRGYALLKPMGRYILYGLSNSSENKSLSAARFWWQVDKVPPMKLYDENKSIGGLNLRHLMYQHGNNEFVRRIVEQVFKLWEEKKIKPVIDSVWALEDAVEAMQKMYDHKNIGKIIFDLNLEPKPKPATPVKSKLKDKKNLNQEEKKSSIDVENSENQKESELTNGTSEDKSDSGSKGKESS